MKRKRSLPGLLWSTGKIWVERAAKRLRHTRAPRGEGTPFVLPAELLVHILERCDAVTLARCRFVSRLAGLWADTIIAKRAKRYSALLDEMRAAEMGPATESMLADDDECAFETIYLVLGEAPPSLSGWWHAGGGFYGAHEGPDFRREPHKYIGCEVPFVELILCARATRLLACATRLCRRRSEWTGSTYALIVRATIAFCMPQKQPGIYPLARVLSCIDGCAPEIKCRLTSLRHRWFQGLYYMRRSHTLCVTMHAFMSVHVSEVHPLLATLGGMRTLIYDIDDLGDTATYMLDPDTIAHTLAPFGVSMWHVRRLIQRTCVRDAFVVTSQERNTAAMLVLYAIHAAKLADVLPVLLKHDCGPDSPTPEFIDGVSGQLWSDHPRSPFRDQQASTAIRNSPTHTLASVALASFVMAACNTMRSLSPRPE